MFNKKKIERLEFKVESLEYDSKRHEEQIWRMLADNERLMQHLGLKFEDVHERKVVKHKAVENLVEKMTI